MPWNEPELEMASTQERRGEDGMGLVVVGLHILFTFLSSWGLSVPLTVIIIKDNL